MTGDDIILTAAGMKAAEQAMFDSGVPEYALMERAGEAAADIIWRAGHLRPVLVLCGPGNNGGDGFVIARLLRARGVPVRVAATGESRTSSAIRAREAWGGPVESIETVEPAAQLVDALFGTGLTRGLDGGLAARLDALVARAQLSYAVDLPSGVDTDHGTILSPVPRFNICIALGALKPAHVLEPSAGRFDRLIRADIGTGSGSGTTRADAALLAPPLLSAPAADAHKYRRGLVAVVGGEMDGAAGLAARAAARGGAGYVRHLAMDAVRPIGLDAIVSRDTGDETVLRESLSDARIAAVLVGPGLGRSAGGRARLEAALSAGHRLVLDADALMLLEGAKAVPEGAILTPHEGEFVALFGTIDGSKIERTRTAAARCRSVVVLKGPDTVIAAPDGRVRVARGLSSWLSTAGTGDVLAGLTAARLAVTHDPFRAACEAVWLHGDAARRAGAAFAADDLLPHVPSAIAARIR
jgi:hydroxyethylthiazole kinase-like uncharacterized protein yjeF